MPSFPSEGNLPNIVTQQHHEINPVTVTAQLFHEVVGECLSTVIPVNAHCRQLKGICRKQ
jgi:hypothetical protein